MGDILGSEGNKGRESKFKFNKMISKIILSPRIVCYDLENSGDQRHSNSKLISSKDSRSGSKSNNFQIPMELVESYRGGQPIAKIKQDENAKPITSRREKK